MESAIVFPRLSRWFLAAWLLCFPQVTVSADFSSDGNREMVCYATPGGVISREDAAQLTAWSERLALPDAFLFRLFGTGRGGTKMIDTIGESAELFVQLVGHILPQELSEPIFRKASRQASPLFGAGARQYWDHNGSRIGLVAHGSRRLFYDATPRAARVERGVTSGRLLFEGERIGNRYAGPARIFATTPCGEFTYGVEGPISSDQRGVTMVGCAPRVNSRCNVTGYRDDTLVFSLDRVVHASGANARKVWLGETRRGGA